MPENITKVESKDCCGCGACFNICPTNAITMQENDEGFLAPVIDKTKCTNCGLCVKACPSLNVKYENTATPECYAAMGDYDLRMKSSSGGMFTLLAEYILDKGGYVCGAAFDENWDVHHIIVDNKDDLEKLRGSKYVQSNTKDCYKKIKKLLNDDKYVLFSGCPCQVAGLYSFLGKNYENLFTVDILCHGAPSPGVWQKYLNETFDKNNIQKINFRDKNKIGWSCSHCTISTKNGEDIITEDFTKLFHASINLRKSCYDCDFSKKPRPADITIGDFWGIHNYISELNVDKGISLVLINNQKGKFLFNEISDKVTYKNISLSENYNNGHQKIGLKMHPKRSKFFQLVNKYSYKQAENIIHNKYDVCLITTFYAENYGAILVAYAVNKIIEKLGYSVLMLQRPNCRVNKKSFPMIFAQKHYNISRVYNGANDLVNLNNHCENFVVGSDQLFSYILNIERAFLGFVSNTKNKIAFATSFGRDEYNTTAEVINERKTLLNRFNHISLREKGTKLCNEIFDLANAVEVIDPTQMLPAESYSELCRNVYLKEAQKPYLLTYALDINQEKAEAIKYVANKLGLNIVYIRINIKSKQQPKTDLKIYKDTYTPEEFLYLYKNASFVISDSYHGTLFALKFNKPFISMVNIARGALRYKLFEELKLTHRLINFPQEVYTNPDLLTPVDFSYANKVIESKADFAINWLKSALENNNSNEKFSAFENYMELKIKELEKKVSALPAEDASYKQQFLLLGNKYDILKKYYRYKLFAKILRGKKQEHYILKSKIYHEKVRIIRKLEKELEL